MTREEAKHRLLDIERCTPIHTREDARDFEALEMAIQALSQDPCTDAVSRAELLKAIDTWDKFGYTETGCFVREPKGDYVAYIHYDDVIKCIKGMPPVTPQPKTGHWIRQDNTKESLYGWYFCSECNSVIGDKTKFCSNCGARMVEPQERSGEE